MRYFIFKDAQILGPFERDALDQAAGGLRPETLVSEELGGGREGDWRAVGEVPELSGVRVGPGAAVSLMSDGLAGGGAGLMERLELETLGVGAQELPGDWMAGFFDDAEFRQRWGKVLPEPDPALGEDPQVRALRAQLETLQERIRELEARATIAEAAAMNLLGTKTVGTRPDEKRVTESSAGLTEPPSPAEPAMGVPAMKVRNIAPPPAVVESPAVVEPPAVVEQPPVVETSSDDRSEEKRVTESSAGLTEAPAPAKPALRGPRFSLNKPVERKPAIKFGVVKTFKAAEPSSPVELPPPPSVEAPAALPPAASAQAPSPAFEWAAAQPPSGGLPGLPPAQAASLPPLPIPTPASVPAPSAGIELPQMSPPQPLFGEAPAAAAPALTMGLGLPPISLSAPSDPPTGASPLGGEGGGPIPMPPVTMRFGPQGAAPPQSGMPSLPALETPSIPDALQEAQQGLNPAAGPVLTPSRSNEPPTSQGTPTNELIARLAKPAKSEPAPQPKKRSSAFLIVSVIVALALAGAGFYLLRGDNRALVSMSPEKPIEEQSTNSGSAENEATASSAGPTEAPPAAAPPASEPDLGEQATELVKGYPLDGDRGTVGQWLQYQFTADPGAGNTEEWTAGAVEATVFLVQYRVLPGANSGSKEAITYLFEADVARKTVKGSNPAAQRLLGGVPAAKKAAPKVEAEPKPAARKPGRRPSSPRRKTKAPAAEPRPRTVPLAPLPTDSELMPPADDDSEFRPDTVEGEL